MIDNQDSINGAVDRQEETVITQQPGFTATEQTSRDVAAERRMKLFQVRRILYSVLSLLQILLGLRFFLKMIAANPDSGFSVFVYGITGLFVAAFANLVGNPTWGDAIFEVTTLIAMMIYALLFWGIVQTIRIVSDRPSARTVTRTTREQLPETGTERTTRIVRKD